MNRRDAGVRPSGTARLRPWLLAVVLFGPAGCTEPLARPQAADETERDRYEVQTIGDLTQVGNALPTPLGGVGLVVGLDGTGGESASEYRTMYENELHKMGVKDVKYWSNLPDSAIVLVSAVLPPGSRKGDKIDVEVALPPRSRATSLRGGKLMECVLYNYDFTRNLNPNPDTPQQMLRGHPLAKAEGPVLVGFGAGDEALRVKRGRLWGGAVAKIDWPMTLVLNADYQTPKWASQIANRINEVFDGGLRGAGGNAVAKARDPFVIPLLVPSQYRLNLPHYLRVVRAITTYNVADLPDDRPDNRPYRWRLSDDLLDPAHTISAALRLEALGPTALPGLRKGLESSSQLVRFASAQALAYLNSPSAASELTRIVKEQPVLRAFALTALASLDEAVAESCLSELLTTSGDDETRYGAFRALRARNEENPLVQGITLNDSFGLHRVAPQSTPLIHVSTNGRAEIVLFGEEPVLQAPFAFHAADFTVTASAADGYCTVSRYPDHGVPAKRQCKTLRVAEVLRTMADLGGAYPEVIELLNQADRCKCLSCRLRYDALPLGTSVYDLAKAGKGDKDLLRADLDDDPTLYANPTRPRRPPPSLNVPVPGAGE